MRYFKEKAFASVLDLGCGNGWFSHRLSKAVGRVTAIDVNLPELKQAVKVFPSANIDFCYADIFTTDLTGVKFQAITLNACFQYFEDSGSLIQRLKELLTDGGEIHIIDSPFYSPERVKAAIDRTETYYRNLGFPKMADHYFHHTWNVLEKWDHEVLYSPNSLSEKLKHKLGNANSPFPWIRIRP